MSPRAHQQFVISRESRTRAENSGYEARADAVQLPEDDMVYVGVRIRRSAWMRAKRDAARKGLTLKRYLEELICDTGTKGP